MHNTVLALPRCPSTHRAMKYSPVFDQCLHAFTSYRIQSWETGRGSCQGKIGNIGLVELGTVERHEEIRRIYGGKKAYILSGRFQIINI